VRPFEFGGTSGTADVAAATIALIEEGKSG
jgi:hypothetical protein